MADEERHLDGVRRVRNVAVAVDWAVMLLADEDSGALLRVSREWPRLLLVWSHAQQLVPFDAGGRPTGSILDFRWLASCGSPSR